MMTTVRRQRKAELRRRLEDRLAGVDRELGSRLDSEDRRGWGIPEQSSPVDIDPAMEITELMELFRAAR